MYCHRDGGASNMRQVCVPLTRAFPGPPYLAGAAVGGPAFPSRALARTPTSSACSVSAPWVPRRRTILWDDHPQLGLNLWLIDWKTKTPPCRILGPLWDGSRIHPKSRQVPTIDTGLPQNAMATEFLEPPSLQPNLQIILSLHQVHLQHKDTINASRAVPGNQAVLLYNRQPIAFFWKVIFRSRI